MSEAHDAAVIDPSDSQVTVAKVMARLPSNLSRFSAPTTVRVSASRPGISPPKTKQTIPRSQADVPEATEITLHFVNYNREEPVDKNNRGSGIKDERPIAAPAFEVDFKLRREQRVARIEFLTPEAEQTRELEFDQVTEPDFSGARLRFRVPEFLVYGVVRIRLTNSE